MTKQQLGQKIARARLLKRLTQDQLATTLGTRVQRISAIERGEINITLDKLTDLCEALDLILSVETGPLEFIATVPTKIKTLNWIDL